jgi:hypothetical protein
MFRITIECVDVPVDAGPSAAIDIETEFREHRTWWAQPQCVYRDGRLTLTATSEVDSDGRALLDEFGDCLVAYMGANGPVRIVSAERVR